MKRDRKRGLCMLLALLCCLLAITGCGRKQSLYGTATNDIPTFRRNTENKPVVRIGTQYFMPDDSLIDALSEAFPDYFFIMDRSLTAGSYSELRLGETLEHDASFDLVICNKTGVMDTATRYCYDLSSESFLNGYLLSALNDASIDGHIYSIPGPSVVTGIAYNTEMFKEHGWEVPKDLTAFFALCAEIQAAGIRPMSNCFKYDNQIQTLFSMCNYKELYLTHEGADWVEKVQTGEAAYSDNMRPFFALAKRYADEGIATIDDFTASLTQQRQDFWAGEYAMIYYGGNIFTLAEVENAPFKVGLMPFPSENAEDSGYAISPKYYIVIMQSAAEDPARLALLKQIVAYLSTDEGQHVLMASELGISNLRDVDMSDNPAFAYIREAYENGNMYPDIAYLHTSVAIFDLQKAAIQTLFEGADVDEALAMMDRSMAEALAAGAADQETYEVIATAETDFTMLETSYYMADKLREAAGTDIGVMINDGYFCSNLGRLYAGDITSDTRRFVLKGVGAEDYLTGYELSGAQIRQMLERPVINGVELDAFVAVSGLSVEYAPWNERGSRVLKLSLEDGTALDDDTLYTVAAWKGVIDERYITNTLTTYDTLGTFPDIMLRALSADKTIRPDISDRVTLIWPDAA